MTSQINTNGINVNYPVPGQNNSSQGFRDNFAQIKTQLNTGGTEITDLQNKVILKAALTDTTLNNDMANTQISNVSTRGFRATSFNLGSSLAGTVLVDVNRADVQYGSLTGNVTLQFGGWSPTNTESNVVLRFTVANANAVVSFPSSVVSSNNNFGVTLLENYATIATVATVTAPSNVTILEYRFSSLDCGNTITVDPVNRPFQATQVITRDPPPTGLPGDISGTVAVGASVNQLKITGANTDPYLTTSGNTTQLYTGLPVVFTGVTLESNVVIGNTYYVRNVVSSTTFTVSSTIGGANVAIGANATGTTMFANPTSYVYVATDSYNSNAYAKTVTNTYATSNYIKLSGTANLAVNAPIIFTGTVFGGIVSNQVYYVTTIDGGASNITVSLTRTNGIAGSNIALTTATGTATATCYTEGNDIWKRIAFTPW